MSKQRHSLLHDLCGWKQRENMIQLVGKWEVIAFGPGLSLCICSLLGFNAFCQILNSTTKSLITPWHSASGKRAGLESAAVTSSRRKHTLKSLRKAEQRLVILVFKQATTPQRVSHLTNTCTFGKHGAINRFCRVFMLLNICKASAE